MHMKELNFLPKIQGNVGDAPGAGSYYERIRCVLRSVSDHRAGTSFFEYGCFTGEGGAID